MPINLVFIFYNYQGHEESNDLDKDTICSVLNLTKEDLDYVPPKLLQFSIPSTEMDKIFDYQTSKLLTTGKLRGDVLNKILNESGIVCTFNSRREPIYPKRQGFVKINGYCPCSIKFTLKIDNKPVQGKPTSATLTSSGLFTLIPERNTRRPISGQERALLAKELEKTKSMSVFCDKLNHSKGLRLLHKGVLQNTEVLRTIKSQERAKKRFDTDMASNLALYRQHLKNTHHPDKKIPGYIQYLNPDKEEFKMMLYDDSSIRLLRDIGTNQTVSVHLDATGGLFKPLQSTVRQNQKHNLLLYSMIASTSQGSFVLADMISNHGKTNDIRYFVGKVCDAVKLLSPIPTKGVPSFYCVDFSFALIHGINEGHNLITTEDYLQRAYQSLQTGESKFKPTQACISLCANHLVKSFLDNTRKKVDGQPYAKELVKMGVQCLAKIMESSNLEEVKSGMADMSTIFGNKEFNSQKLQTIIDRIKSVDTEEWFGPSEEDASVLSEDLAEAKLLRERSPFYHLFKGIRQTTVRIPEDDSIRNPYFSEEILDTYEKTYAAYCGLYCRGVVQICKDSAFIRTSNAVVESSFRLLKEDFVQNPVNMSTFVRTRFAMHTSKMKQFIQPKQQRRKYEKKIQEIELHDDLEDLLNNQDLEEEASFSEEKWSKKETNQKKATFLHGRDILKQRDTMTKTTLSSTSEEHTVSKDTDKSSYKHLFKDLTKQKIAAKKGKKTIDVLEQQDNEEIGMCSVLCFN
jgi:hypothetical protein